MADRQNPVTYAEQTLGVHDVYRKAEARLDELQAAQAAATDARRVIRMAKDELADREREITNERRAENHEMTDTAFKKAIKEWIAADKEHQRIQVKLREAESDRDAADADVKRHEHGVRVHAARMEELAGLLHFYAAVNQASIPNPNQGETHE